MHFGEIVPDRPSTEKWILLGRITFLNDFSDDLESGLKTAKIDLKKCILYMSTMVMILGVKKLVILQKNGDLKTFLFFYFTIVTEMLLLNDLVNVSKKSKTSKRNFVFAFHMRCDLKVALDIHVEVQMRIRDRKNGVRRRVVELSFARKSSYPTL